MVLAGSEIFTQNRSSVLQTNLQNIIREGEIVFPLKLQTLGKVKREDLPLQEVSRFLPFVSGVQKFHMQDSMFRATPSADGFDSQAVTWYTGNALELGFESPPKISYRSELLEERWRGVIYGAVKKMTTESIGDPATYVAKRPSTGKPVLLSLAAPDLNKYVAICPAFSSEQAREVAPVVLLDFINTKSLLDFSKFIESVGTNGLNAFFSLLLSPKITKKFESFPILRKELQQPTREVIFNANPTKDVRAFVTNYFDLPLGFEK
jgi:hypothetical protein